MVKFVILTTQRSGSTFLWRYLDSHPEISSHGEMFLKSLQRSDGYPAYWKSGLIKRMNHFYAPDRSVRNYIDHFLSTCEKHKAAGFKLMYNQLSPYPELERWILNENVHVLHLIRKNILKMILSRETAARRQLYHNTEKNTQKLKVPLAAQSLIKDIGEVEKEVEYHRDKCSNVPYLEIYYEDYFQNIVERTQVLLDFLGIEQNNNMHCELKKINTESLRDIIENYDEVEGVLKGTPYEKFLY